MMPPARLPQHATAANGKQVRMLVTSVAGHVYENDFDASTKKWSSCDPAKLLDLSTPVLKFIPEASRAHACRGPHDPRRLDPFFRPPLWCSHFC